MDPVEPDNPEPRWLTREEQDAWRAFLHGGAQLLEVLDQDLRQHFRISLAEYDVLSRLSMQPDHKCRMADLAAMANQSRSRLSHTCRRLEKAGYVSRYDDPGDGRGVIASLTQSGWDLIKRAAKLHVAGVRRLFLDPVDPADYAAMGRVFLAVEANIVADCQAKGYEEPPC